MKAAWILLLIGLSPVWAQPSAAADALFEPIFSVLTHPRCLNCHTETEFPRQGDERRRHDQLVVRGKDNHGAPTLHCSACHQDQNSADGAVPGAPHWGLAPLSMAWENLLPGALCERLIDTSQNGQRDLQDLLQHMQQDALVLWGWAPGGDRSTPPLSHPEFVQALEAWVQAGGPCPSTD